LELQQATAILDGLLMLLFVQRAWQKYSGSPLQHPKSTENFSNNSFSLVVCNFYLDRLKLLDNRYINFGLGYLANFCYQVAEVSTLYFI